VKRIMKLNHLVDGEYVEPYAGVAAIALELLFHEFVSHVHVNDLNRPVYAFWHSVLTHTDEICRLVCDTPRTVESWDAQKRTLQNQEQHDGVESGRSRVVIENFPANANFCSCERDA
jgi:DNA adenine methylase